MPILCTPAAPAQNIRLCAGISVTVKLGVGWYQLVGLTNKQLTLVNVVKLITVKKVTCIVGLMPKVIQIVLEI